MISSEWKLANLFIFFFPFQPGSKISETVSSMCFSRMKDQWPVWAAVVLMFWPQLLISVSRTIAWCQLQWGENGFIYFYTAKDHSVKILNLFFLVLLQFTKYVRNILFYISFFFFCSAPSRNYLYKKLFFIS